MAQVTMKDMLDAGVHFGHQTQRWNPKMKPYVYTARGGIHIIDLQKTVVRANTAAEFVKSIAASGGKMVFVGTKKQAIEPVIEAATKSGQFHVTKRWLGGMLTNFETIKTSIDRLKRIDAMREKGELEFFTKKERFKMEKEYLKLSEYLSGIRDMKEMPKAIFIVDLVKEHIAVEEATKLGIPVVGIADTNCDPELIAYPIPGNDDAIRSIKLFANLVAESYLEGAKEWENKLRASTDKASDNKDAVAAKDDAPVEKRKARPGKKVEKEEKPHAGPQVVKVQKQRKLVAAGLAEKLEIEAELDNQDGTKEDAE